MSYGPIHQLHTFLRQCGQTPIRAARSPSETGHNGQYTCVNIGICPLFKCSRVRHSQGPSIRSESHWRNPFYPQNLLRQAVDGLSMTNGILDNLAFSFHLAACFSKRQMGRTQKMMDPVPMNKGTLNIKFRRQNRELPVKFYPRTAHVLKPSKMTGTV